MPLSATHIRFALDLQNEYKIKDLEKYIAGTVYPDSRYFTGIDRTLTHGEEIFQPEFATDDFKKGWQAHRICDRLQNKVKTKIFPEFFPENVSGDEQRWIDSTALKIIEDMDDMQKFDIQTCLKYLEYANNPNGEKIELIRESNQSLVSLYRDKKVATIDDYYKALLFWKIDEELCKKVIETTKIFLADASLVDRVKNIYEEMMEEYKRHHEFNKKDE